MSEFVEWDPELATGDMDVDDQHRSLFALVNDMHDQIIGGHGHDAVNGSIDAVVDYVHSHFGFEEALMERIYYPELDKQIRMHREFTDEIDNLRQEMLGGELVSPMGMLEYMRSWLVNHVGAEDRKIGEYIRSLSA
jgi:hemerythrin-like metal-binding protein